MKYVLDTNVVSRVLDGDERVLGPLGAVEPHDVGIPLLVPIAKSPVPGHSKGGEWQNPGVSVFLKDEAGEVFHTYSTYGRGLDTLNGTYQFLDLVPKGRDEASLPFPQSWVSFHDEYPQSA